MNGKIGFLDIYTLIEEAMAAHRAIDEPQLDEILAVEQDTWRITEHWISRHSQI